MPTRSPRISGGQNSERGKPSWMREVVVGLISGAVVAAGATLATASLDDRRSVREDKRENLRFVRERSSEKAEPRPFNHFDLARQNLSGLHLDGADFLGANLRESVLFQAHLKGAQLAATDLYRANIRLADLTKADLSSSNLQGAQMMGAKMVGAKLRYADLRSSDLSGVDLSGADLVLARLDGATLGESVLDAVTFGSGNGETVCYDDATKWPEDFTPPAMNETSCRSNYPE